MKRSGNEAIRTQIQPSKPKRVITKTRIFRGSDYSPTIALSEDKDIQGHIYV